jgi:hypothetical protein
MTHDIDLVVDLNREAIKRISEAFPLEAFYCPPSEILELEARRSLRGHFNLVHHQTALKADVYIVGQDALHHWATEKMDLETVL